MVRQGLRQLLTTPSWVAQVWALAVGGAGEGLLATGASDATVAVWEDCTAADEEEAAAEEAAIVLKQQDLSNALQVGSTHFCSSVRP